MIGTLGNIKENFGGSREYAMEFLRTGELNKSEFMETTYFWVTREKLQFFLGNKGTRTPAPHWKALNHFPDTIGYHGNSMTC